jgi:hypothetical protein
VSVEKYRKKIDYWTTFYDTATRDGNFTAAKKAWINIMRFQQILKNFEETGKFTLKKRRVRNGSND